MDLDILLWIGGMLFSLGIFALKVGLGLACGKVGPKGVAAALTGYLALFVAIALAAEQLVRWLEPLLRNGVWLHSLSATGLIAWGMYLVIGRRTSDRHGAGAGLLLIIPCPICLTAICFSTWAALNAIRLPAPLVGLGLGLAFGVLAAAVWLAARLRPGQHSQAPLGLAMVVIGLYLIASLFLPAKVKEAQEMYGSFIMENAVTESSGGMGALALLPVLLLIGFFAGKRRGRI
jgi:predicted transporter